MGRPRGLGHIANSVRQGFRYGYPVCCIAHFCWDALFGWPSGVVRCRQVRRTQGDGPVPCGVFHAGDSPYGFGRRISRILRFYWWALQPTAAGRLHLSLARNGSDRWHDLERKRRAAQANELLALYWGDPGGEELDLRLSSHGGHASTLFPSQLSAESDRTWLRLGSMQHAK